MYFEKNFKCGTRVAIIVRSDTENRLRTRCFRGVSLPLAGNFHRWGSPDDLFHDDEVMKYFLNELQHVWSGQDFATHSVNIFLAEPVGWESTAARTDYPNDALEPFHMNRRSWGLRVRPERTDLFAPQTNEVTIIYELKSEDDKAAAVIHSIYPGYDVGELKGDVTERENRVFFDWNHPGQL